MLRPAGPFPKAELLAGCSVSSAGPEGVTGSEPVAKPQRGVCGETLDVCVCAFPEHHLLVHFCREGAPGLRTVLCCPSSPSALRCSDGPIGAALTQLLCCPSLGPPLRALLSAVLQFSRAPGVAWDGVRPQLLTGLGRVPLGSPPGL